jgi:hypothetical protein
MESQSQRVYTLFVVDGEHPRVLTVESDGVAHIPNVEMTSEDGFGTIMGASRTVINEIGDVEVMKLSLWNASYSNLVNWEAMKSAQEKWSAEPPTQVVIY